jgi:cytochrome c-type biogenesis protein CcmH/NrfG
MRILVFGVACVFLYTYESSQAVQNFIRSFRLSSAESLARQDEARSLLAEQNATNGQRAEEHLQKTLTLDPRNTRVLEYVATLYSHWLDPVIEAF